MLKKTMLLFLVLGSTRSVMFGMENADSISAKAQTSLFDVSDEKVLKRKISDLDINKYSGLKEAVARLSELTPQKIAEILLSIGLNIWDAYDCPKSLAFEHNRTPLHSAAYYGDVDVVNVLLMAGPEEYITFFVMVPDCYHCYGNWKLKKLRKYDCDCRWNSALQFAAMKGHAKVIKVLMDSLPEVGRETVLMDADQWGLTALHHAVISSHVEAARELLKYYSSVSKIPEDLAPKLKDLGL